ncbi:MAG: PilZ domain-containing protein [Polyangiaceae bacterium]
MNKRRSLTPVTGLSKPGEHAMRRGGARQTVSDRVTFRGAGSTVREGWALNVSRGGVRAILDDDTGKVELGEEYDITVGNADPAKAKKGRIVWLQEEPDGFVVGVEYLVPAEVTGETSAVSAAADPPSDGEKKT